MHLPSTGEPWALAAAASVADGTVTEQPLFVIHILRVHKNYC